MNKYNLCGIYGYWDNEKQYVAYIGKDSNIGINKRHYDHSESCYYNEQPFNRVLQNNPDRYEYFILAKGEFTEKELNEMESQAIKIFKTYHYDYPERSVFNFTKGGDGSTGYKQSKKTKNRKNIIISRKKNKYGFFGLTKEKHKDCKQGFRWIYNYSENGKQRQIKKTNLFKLIQTVKLRDLPWFVVDNKKAINTIRGLYYG